MSIALRFLLTLFTILCCTTISGAAVREAHEGVVFEKRCVIEGEIGYVKSHGFTGSVQSHAESLASGFVTEFIANQENFVADNQRIALQRSEAERQRRSTLAFKINDLIAASGQAAVIVTESVYSELLSKPLGGASYTFSGGYQDISGGERAWASVGFATLPVMFARPVTVGRGAGGAVVGRSTEPGASAFARGLQGSGSYPGIDRFRDITIKKGTIIFGGAPGQTNFYTTASGLRRANGSSSSLFQGLQVGKAPPHIPSHPITGRYRPGVTAYEVTQDLPAAFGRTLNNPQFGSGGLPQIVIENYQDYLRPINSILLGK